MEGCIDFWISVKCQRIRTRDSRSLSTGYLVV